VLSRLKTDNAFNCSQFDEHLRAFIDDELPVNVQSAFLAHASACAGCARELREMKFTRKMLGSLTRVEVRPEFDFRMNLRIRKEYQNTQSPWYSLKLAFRENLSKFVVIPAATAVLIVALAVYHSFSTSNTVTTIPAEAQFDSGKGVELVMDDNESANEQINYILETVSPNEIQQGFFSPFMYGSGDGSGGSQDITLISF
jgi:hypothetical protein